ncbi:glutamate synthase-related protein, partial [Deinococcus pimensis]|uniref:glutamate synthase-related protein n=1 Tax=Deinococcus pimensis TaxID=309888 RepID=UPI0005EBBC23
ADGGLKSALDVARMVALGADRVGFGTLSMVAIGCTICRGCQLDTCHVGITTQVETEAEAKAHGFKRFVPRDLPVEVERLTRFFTGLAQELRVTLANLGLGSLRELRGRTDLLTATSSSLDLAELLSPAPTPEGWERLGRRVIHRPLNSTTRMLSEWIGEALDEDEVIYRDGPVLSADRALGTHTVGTLQRGKTGGPQRVKLHFDAGSIPGNG